MAGSRFNLHDKKRKIFKNHTSDYSTILFKKYGVEVKEGDNVILHILGPNPEYKKFEDRKVIDYLKGVVTTDDRTLFEGAENPMLLEYATNKAYIEYRYVTHNEKLYDLWQ